MKIHLLEQEEHCTGADFLDEYFLLINGDTLFDINYHDLAKSFPKNKLVHIALNFVQDVSRYRSNNSQL